MEIAVIIPAAGSGTRYAAAGGVRAKLDEDLGGKPVIQRTVELFSKHDWVRWIIVAGPHDPEAFVEFKSRHGDRLALLNVTVCRGGRTHRHESVAAALAQVHADATHIAVHDAARPCVTPELIDRVFALAEHHDAVVPGVDVADTLKRVRDTGERARPADPMAAILGESAADRETLRVVEATVPRERLVAVQTPQVFKADVLRRAYAQADLTSTDDAGLVERLGVAVAVAAGDVRNIKITRPDDVTLARAILGVRPPESKPAHLRF